MGGGGPARGGGGAILDNLALNCLVLTKLLCWNRKCIIFWHIIYTDCPIIGEVRGSKKPAEQIELEPFDTRAKFLTRRAHFDHVGLGSPGPRGSPNHASQL